jgi:TRAP-type uncharacterized transport system substrate-binding protein
MPRLLRITLVSARDLALAAGPFVLIALVLLVAAYAVLDPQPPRRVVLATGPEPSAYAEFGRRYAEALKRHGITVELKSTPGSRENLRLLRDPGERVDFAFVQGGAGESARAQEEEKHGLALLSLGSLTYEPVWIFYRAEAAKALGKDAKLGALGQLRGWRVDVGARGSGAPGLFGRLLRDNFIEREEIRRSNLDQTPAVVALLEGELDALVMVSAPESPLVQTLLATPGVRLYEFAQAEAYARRHPYLVPITLPRGVADIARDVPPEDIDMIATTTSLVAREGTHPALVQLFVQAASRIHSGPGWIARAGQFPAPQKGEFPLAREAERYYRSGPPLLQRYLPFWLANLVDRMWVALVSIIAILIPLGRIVPPLYAFRVRSRIFRWYRQLRELEHALASGSAERGALLADLERLDAKAERITVPLSYTDELYHLRAHIALVRNRVSAPTERP